MRGILPFKNAGLGAILQNTTQPGEACVPQAIIDELNGTMFFKGEQIIWPSAEAAFHAQKLIGYYCDLRDTSGSGHPNLAVIQSMVNEILRSSSTQQYFSFHFTILVAKYFNQLAENDNRLPAIRNPFGRTDDEKKRNAFDQVCGTHYHRDLQDKRNAIVEFPAGSRRIVPKTYQLMVSVQYARILQHLEKGEHSVAVYCAKNGIFPVEISRHDVVWATGPNGDGENLLGIAILEAANMVLKKHPKLGATQIPAPWEIWKNFTIGNQASTQLKHDYLEDKQQEILLNLSQPQPSRKENNDLTQVRYNKNQTRRLTVHPDGSAEHHYHDGDGQWKLGTAPKDPEHYLNKELAKILSSRTSASVSQNQQALFGNQNAAHQPLLPKKEDGCPRCCIIT